MPSDVKIRVLFDSTEASAAARRFTETAVTGNKAVGDSAKQAAAATLAQARVTKTLADAGLQTARAQELDARATLSNERAKRSLSQALSVETSTRKINTTAIDQEAKAQERLALASSRALATQRRTAIAGENRQWRDEGASIRQSQSVSRDRMRFAGDAGAGAAIAGGATLIGLASTFGPTSELDQSLHNVASLVKTTTAQFQQMHDGVISLTKDPLVRQMPQDLAGGLYDVASAGYSGQKALDLLHESAIGASAGMTDTATSSKVLLAVLNSGIPGVHSAREAMDVLFTEVNLGINTFPQLAESIGEVLPVAAKANVSLQEVASAMVVMTKTGLSAGQSATDLNQLLIKLINPPKEVAKQMDQMGIKHGLAAVQAEGLGGAIRNVTEATQGHEDQLAKLFPRIESFIGFLAIAKRDGKDYTDTLNAMTHASDGVGAAHAAAAEQAKGAAFEADKVKQNYEVLAITTGEKLLPVTRQLEGILTSVADAFNRLTPAEQDAMVKTVAITAVIATLLGGAVSLAAKIATVTAELRTMGIGSSAAATAMDGLAFSETAVASAGLATFAIGGALALAIGAFAVYTKTQWDSVSEAQDQALRGARDYQKHMAGMAGSGDKKTQLFGKQQLLMQGVGGIDQTRTAIRNIKAYPYDYFGADFGGGAYVGQKKSTVLEEKIERLNTLLGQYANTTTALGSFTAVKTDAGMAARGDTAGARVANQALSLHIQGSAEKFRGYCQQLVRTTVQSVTHAYDPYFKGSARASMAAFEKAGIGHPYRPGEALAPGSILYSGRWGGKDGHAMLAGPNGEVIDNVGTGDVSPSRRPIDYVVPMGGSAAAGAKTTKAGAGAPMPPTAEQIALREEAISATQGQYAGERARAKDKYERDRSVNAAQAWAVYQGELKRIHAEEIAEQKKHTDALTAEGKRQQAARDKVLAMAGPLMTLAAKTVGGALSGDMTALGAAGRSPAQDAAAYRQQQSADAAAAKKAAKDAQDAKQAAQETLTDTQDRAFETGTLAFTEYIKILQARLKAAQGDGEALISIGRQIDSAFEQESSRQNQIRQAQGAAIVKAGQEYRPLGDIALDAGDGPNLSRPTRARPAQTVGGLSFWGGLEDGASQMSGQIVGSLLSGRGASLSIKSFWRDVSGIGVNAVSQAMTSITSNALQSIMGGGGKGAFSGVAALFKGAKGDLLAGAAGIYGAAMALGAGGKKKQKHSILGGLLGFAAGSLLPGIGNLEGAEFGSALGGMFADGGRPPVGRVSLIGERGPELWVPDSAGQVIPLASSYKTMATGSPRAASTQTISGNPSFQATAPHIHIEQNIHSPVYHSDVDTERDHERLGRALEKSFLLG